MVLTKALFLIFEILTLRFFFVFVCMRPYGSKSLPQITIEYFETSQEFAYQ